MYHESICIQAWVVVLLMIAMVFLLCCICILCQCHIFNEQDDLSRLKKKHEAVLKELSELKRAQIVVSPPQPTTTTTTTRLPLHPPSYCGNDRFSTGMTFGQSRVNQASLNHHFS
jgi:hypothetical protein